MTDLPIAPPISRELYGIQMLRGLAALAVVVHHALGASDLSAGRFSPAWLTMIGGAGVDLFFVISGVIMMHTSFVLGRRTLAPLEFLRRRFLRIFPFYWACLAAMIAIAGLGFMQSLDIGAVRIALSLALLPGGNIIGVSWTLSYELYFYLIFAAALLSRSRLATAAITCGLIAAMLLAANLAMAPGSTAQAFLAFPVVLEFCFGIAITALVGRELSRGLRIGLCALGCAAILASVILVPPPMTADGYYGASRTIVWGLPAALIVLSSFGIRKPGSSFASGLVFLGDASYAIYLTHPFTVIAYSFLLKKTALGSVDQIVIAPAVVCLALVLGILSHVTVERPLTSLLRRRPAMAAPAAAA